eukprot:CAMPEP_0172200754 /NCGR_PEP_ID=MMETSP1050-20130122/29539_1 /TAXON_ID=233186 /ORGANISM="Cryptomonas curvata, Strain CCAP979/52" /LENGTH=227 /DNA_ID=CAMNT_0012878163 /DNA_START=171 /DNA_END=851 /DNA_ORIENTATION=+
MELGMDDPGPYHSNGYRDSFYPALMNMSINSDPVVIHQKHGEFLMPTNSQMRSLPLQNHGSLDFQPPSVLDSFANQLHSAPHRQTDQRRLDPAASISTASDYCTSNAAPIAASSLCEPSPPAAERLATIDDFLAFDRYRRSSVTDFISADGSAGGMDTALYFSAAAAAIVGSESCGTGAGPSGAADYQSALRSPSCAAAPPPYHEHGAMLSNHVHAAGGGPGGHSPL